jgi:hypothetical protein
VDPTLKLRKALWVCFQFREPLIMKRCPMGLALTRLHGPSRVKQSGSVKGVEVGQERQTLLT